MCLIPRYIFCSISCVHLIFIAKISCLWSFLYSYVLDTCVNSSRRHISGSDSIHTNNSQVPLTKSYGGDNTISLENKRRFSSLFPMESLMFLSIMGYSNQRYNGTNQVINRCFSFLVVFSCLPISRRLILDSSSNIITSFRKTLCLQIGIYLMLSVKCISRLLVQQRPFLWYS